MPDENHLVLKDLSNIKSQNNTPKFRFWGILLVFCFVSPFSIGQTIAGSVESVEGEPLNASILFKEAKDSAYTKEFALARNGTFQKVLQKQYKTLRIEIKSQGYYDQIIILENPSKNQSYNYPIQLEKMEAYELEEVVVVGKKKPFKVKEDTVAYNVSAYADGSEQKIEEVIKKLPGVEVNEQSGEIKYKGKSVETVTLDGDNLFGYNYSLGTKNINVNMVEQIEAIDNYAENPLLKGIEQGGKVSLNLKLKKNRIDLSGNMDYGSGWFEGGEQAFNLNANLLGITKKYKSFATLSYNNISVNNTPFDYFGFNFNVEQLKERDFFAQKIIPETQFSNLLDDDRANINKQFFGNYNAIFKLNPKLSIKTNLYYVQDLIETAQFFENQYQINDESFTTSDETFITKKPQQYRADVEVKYNTSKTSLLEYNVRIRQENIDTPTQIIQNGTDSFESFLASEDFYFKQDLLFTQKLSDRKALQVSIFHSYNEAPQTFRISPSVFSNNAANDTQNSEFRKTFLEGKATFLGSGSRDKYSFEVGANANFTPYKSRLFNPEQSISENNFDYTQKQLFNRGVYNFNRGKWKISPSYGLRILSQNLTQNLLNESQMQDDLIFEPALNIKYALNSVSFLSANAGYNQNTNTEQYFFLNQVLIDNRTTVQNLPNLAIQNSQNYSLLYFINDLYHQFQMSANVNYRKSTGNFFTNQNITENTTQIQYFFLPQDNSNWNMNFEVSKYLPFLQSTLKLSSDYSISNFRNIVNNSDLRQNQSQFLNNSFFWKTALDIPVNFQNTFQWQYLNSKNENQNAIVNNALQNTFKVIFKPSRKWFLIVSTDYYLPDITKPNEQFFFLDATLRHSPKSKRWEASLLLKNLTNELNFEQVETSDISTTIFRSNLLPRYTLLNLSWNF